MGWVRRRARREPVAYIVGHKPFRGIELMVDSRVLIPRPETELLVEVAVELAPQGGRVHDVGTGSGAVALALKDERPDLARERLGPLAGRAVDVARANAERWGSTSRWHGGAGLPPGELRPGRREPAVRPRGRVGRRCRRRSAATSRGRRSWAARTGSTRSARSSRAPRPGLLLALEHAPDQAESVREMLDDASTRTDLAGRERVTVGRA